MGYKTTTLGILGKEDQSALRTVLRTDGRIFESSLEYCGNHWIGRATDFNWFINAVKGAIDDNVKFCEFRADRKRNRMILKNKMRVQFESGLTFMFYDGAFFTNDLINVVLTRDGSEEMHGTDTLLYV